MSGRESIGFQGSLGVPSSVKEDREKLPKHQNCMAEESSAHTCGSYRATPGLCPAAALRQFDSLHLPKGFHLQAGHWGISKPQLCPLQGSSKSQFRGDT